MYEKNIICRLIFERGCPVFVIAKTLVISEAEVYRYLNGEKISDGTKVRLKSLWQNLIEMEKELKKIK